MEIEGDWEKEKKEELGDPRMIGGLLCAEKQLPYLHLKKRGRGGHPPGPPWEKKKGSKKTGSQQNGLAGLGKRKTIISPSRGGKGIMFFSRKEVGKGKSRRVMTGFLALVLQGKKGIVMPRERRDQNGACRSGNATKFPQKTFVSAAGEGRKRVHIQGSPHFPGGALRISL